MIPSVGVNVLIIFVWVVMTLIMISDDVNGMMITATLTRGLSLGGITLMIVTLAPSSSPSSNLWADESNSQFTM